MSEEEKKAIRNLENISEFGLSTSLNQADLDKMKIALNLIQKQEKEIYRLQDIKRKDIQDLINNEKVNIYKNYISKDKIREKIKELEKIKKEEEKTKFVLSYSIYDSITNEIDVLKELLED